MFSSDLASPMLSAGLFNLFIDRLAIAFKGFGTSKHKKLLRSCNSGSAVCLWAPIYEISRSVAYRCGETGGKVHANGSSKSSKLLSQSGKCRQRYVITPQPPYVTKKFPCLECSVKRVVAKRVAVFK